MPIPTITGLPPKPEYQDIINKVNRLVQELTNLLLNLDSLNVVSLTADHIDTGTLDARVVTVRSDLAGGAYIRIDGNGMTVNDGTKDVFTVDTNGQVTMTGAKVQTTASSFPRIELSSSGNLLAAYLNANDYIAINPDLTGAPTLAAYAGGAIKGSLSTIGGDTSIYAIGSLLNLLSNYDIRISAGSAYLVKFDSWSKIYNDIDGETLQQALDAKQNTISGATSSFTTADGKTVTVSNGIITSVV